MGDAPSEPRPLWREIVAAYAHALDRPAPGSSSWDKRSWYLIRYATPLSCLFLIVSFGSNVARATRLNTVAFGGAVLMLALGLLGFTIYLVLIAWRATHRQDYR